MAQAQSQSLEEKITENVFYSIPSIRDVKEEVIMVSKFAKYLIGRKKRFEFYEEGESEKQEKDDFKVYYYPSMVLDIKDCTDKRDFVEILERNGFISVSGAEGINVYEKELYKRTGKKKTIVTRMIVEVHYNGEEVYKIVVFLKKLVWLF